MADQTTNGPVTHRAHKMPKAEFYTYFAIIFIAAVPVAALSWLLATVKSGSFQKKGPIARAWSQARIITPMIFAA
ncbi:protein pufQ [Dinoroseobacter shibae DFL 12 = DSM 16493]|uniref:Protein pufQ n=1 Tax=Dinoroseobacter shibae (strain DSM 16493 / NCIMB 14021 / DFL 12) TaxID=398580 RepID=A8LQ13_DINSH|nr:MULTISPECIES: cytochrome PufQ [Dinoroseobacter]ABV95253.1 protein pufQ [Dinoroseobacter shibae DFL 12 = DSM 16493]MDD9718028.1 cytochrome PufQ [Dinoroseobacter sp. PD6]URF46660.1 cytochrome PufQ [Dinoroseobacter shibae]URF50966.1 cytochrome PufQ [Dinoroseobacter shibae]